MKLIFKIIADNFILKKVKNEIKKIKKIKKKSSDKMTEEKKIETEDECETIG
ncbi:MAG: hypothetical protein ACTSPY_09435 [Candidatus Helarchaeota archaeon]